MSCISNRIFASKSCVTHGKSVRVLCAWRECKVTLYFLLVAPRKFYTKFRVLRWNYSYLTLYLSVLKRFKLKLLYFWLKYKRFKTDLNCLQLLCNLLTPLSAGNVMRKHQKRKCFYWLLLTLWGYWFIALEKCLWEFHWPMCQLYFVGVHSFIFRLFSSHSLPLMLWNWLRHKIPYMECKICCCS